VPLQLGRAEALAHAGDAARALAAADELAPEKSLEGCQLYKLARVYALAAKKLPPSEAARATAQADAMWRRAVATGFPEVAAMLKGNDLGALRRRTESADLLWDLADGLMP
jgi:inorganic triphosphatase YgiF